MDVRAFQMETMVTAARPMMMRTFGEDLGNEDSGQIMNSPPAFRNSDDFILSSDQSCGYESEPEGLLFGLPHIDGDLEEIDIKNTPKI